MSHCGQAELIQWGDKLTQEADVKQRIPTVGKHEVSALQKESAMTKRITRVSG